MPLRAIICDIDGCIAPESSTPMHAPALARLAEHNQRATRDNDRPILTLCSGRPQPFVEAMTRLLANTALPAIAENGVWLYHPAENRYDRDPAIGPDHIEAVHALERWVEGTLGPRDVSIQPGKSAAVSLYHPDTDYLRTLPPMLEKACAACNWPFRISMTWLYINCDLTFVSKGAAVDRWIEATDIPAEDVLGIGDTESDLAVRDRVATFACPANAQDAVKAKADFVASKPEIEGVLEILEWAMGSRQ